LQLRIEEHSCLPTKLEMIDPNTARVTLTEGRYHQIRQMFAACGYHVESLHREQFGQYTLGELAPGEWGDVQ
jgi:16S rRNA pseudouridine516 synthase